MREVTYRATFQDWVEGYRVGLAHMTLLYWAIWSGILIAAAVGLGMIVLGKGYPTTWPPTTPPPRPLLLSVGLLVCILLAPYLVVSVAGWHLTRCRTVMLQHHHLVSKTRFRSHAIPWNDITDLLDTGRHFCFCQNAPAAVVVPKLAFADPEQAHAFFDQAEDCWRSERRRRDPPPPDAPGVWPPAPRAGDSQELGETPKR